MIIIITSGYPIMEMTAPDRTTTRIIATPYTINERDT